VNIFPPVPKSFSKAAEDAHMVKNVQVFLDVVKYVEVVSKILVFLTYKAGREPTPYW
jgi:hypothetical protein